MSKKAKAPMDVKLPMDVPTKADRRRREDAPKPPARTPREKSPAAPKPPRAPKKSTAPEPGITLSRQCTANSKQSGKRCRRAPIPGGTVCVMHGGKAPNTQRSARARLAEEVDASISRLVKERDTANRSADRQRAANSILDRAGITRGHSAEIDAARSLLLERLLTLRAVPGQPEPLTLAAEVIEDAIIVDDAEYDEPDDD